MKTNQSHKSFPANCLEVLFTVNKQRKQTSFRKTPKHTKIKLFNSKQNNVCLNQSNSKVKPIKLKPSNYSKLNFLKTLTQSHQQYLNTQIKQYQNTFQKHQPILSLDKYQYCNRQSNLICNSDINQTQKMKRSNSLKASQNTHWTRAISLKPSPKPSQGIALSHTKKIKLCLDKPLSLNDGSDALQLSKTVDKRSKINWKNTHFDQFQNNNDGTKYYPFINKEDNFIPRQQGQLGKQMIKSLKESVQIIDEMKKSPEFQKYSQQKITSPQNINRYHNIKAPLMEKRLLQQCPQIIEQSSQLDKSSFFLAGSLQFSHNMDSHSPLMLRSHRDQQIRTNQKKSPFKISRLSKNARTIISKMDSGSYISRISESIVIQYPIMKQNNLFLRDTIKQNQFDQQVFRKNCYKRLTFDFQDKNNEQKLERSQTNKDIKKVERDIFDLGISSNYSQQLKSAKLDRYNEKKLQQNFMEESSDAMSLVFPSNVTLKTQQLDSQQKVFNKNNNILSNQNPQKQKILYKNLHSISQTIWKINYLGVGRFSNVYKCLMKNSGFLFAMKEISKQIISINSLQKQVAMEIVIQSQLKHPNIIELYHTLQDDQKYFLAMQLAQGTLLQIKNEKPNKCIPIQECIKNLRDIVLGLKFLHHQKIIHRDIKPQNIFIVHGVCKIGDFGWGIEQTMNNFEHCGTPGYISPQIANLKQYSCKTDCWSLGVLAYQIAYGQLPFNFESLNQFSTKQEFNFHQKIQQKQKTYISLKELQYLDFIKKLTQQDQNKRMSAQQASKHPLLEF